MAIDRTSRSMISFEGSSSVLVAKSNAPTVVPNTRMESTDTARQPVTSSAVPINQPAVSSTGSATEDEKVNEFVKMIWKYVSDSEQMIQGMDEEVRFSLQIMPLYFKY